MKKLNLLAATAVLLIVFEIMSSQSAKAQSEIGLKGGIIFSDIKKSGLNSNLTFKRKEGLSLGTFYKKRNVAGKFGFQTELLYQNKGADVSIQSIEGTSVYTREILEELPATYYNTKEVLHYLTFPLLITFQPASFFELYAGPEINYLLSMNPDRIKTSNLNHLSVGIASGLALNLGENTSLDFRYSFDLNHYDDIGNSSSSAKLKNRGFAVTIRQTLFRK